MEIFPDNLPTQHNSTPPPNANSTLNSSHASFRNATAIFRIVIPTAVAVVSVSLCMFVFRARSELFLCHVPRPPGLLILFPRNSESSGPAVSSLVCLASGVSRTGTPFTRLGPRIYPRSRYLQRPPRLFRRSKTSRLQRPSEEGIFLCGHYVKACQLRFCQNLFIPTCPPKPRRTTHQLRIARDQMQLPFCLPPRMHREGTY